MHSKWGLTLSRKIWLMTRWGLISVRRRGGGGMGVAYVQANLWVTPAREGSRRTSRKAKPSDGEELGAEARRRWVCSQTWACSQVSRTQTKKVPPWLTEGEYQGKESDSPTPLLDGENSLTYTIETEPLSNWLHIKISEAKQSNKGNRSMGWRTVSWGMVTLHYVRVLIRRAGRK